MLKPTRDQFRGCLIGQCLGDALGFPVEGHAPAVCASYVAGSLGRIGRASFPFGQYTDDSQLARELMQSVVACGGFDPADYARRIAALFVEERIVGRGLATERAASRIAAGVPWHEAGEPAPAAGNGSAMRAGPVGLFCWNDPRTLARMASEQGRITHQDPRCSGGAIAVAAGVAIALRGGSIDPAAFAGEIAELVEETSPVVAGAIRQLPAWLKLPPVEAVKPIAGVGSDYSDGWRGISPFVIGSVLWSLYAFLCTPDSFMSTMATAIAVGGDVDTTAAMAGAISGARLGFDALPAELGVALEDQGTWRLTELLELADRSHDLIAAATAR